MALIFIKYDHLRPPEAKAIRSQNETASAKDPLEDTPKDPLEDTSKDPLEDTSKDPKEDRLKIPEGTPSKSSEHVCSACMRPYTLGIHCSSDRV